MKTPKRNGLTLLELTLAVGIAAALTIPIVGLLQVAGELSFGFESQHRRRMAQAASIRYLQNQVQRAQRVAVPQPNVLLLEMPEGQRIQLVSDQDHVVVLSETGASSQLPEIQSAVFRLIAVRSNQQAPSVPHVVLTAISFSDGSPQQMVRSWVRKLKT